uniref:Peptidase M41 FtsH extracellular domain-containing protein n=1 Tax=Romanomermis culicivorax TaxID=13658 RepID=A0A915J8N5_ROMCU
MVVNLLCCRKPNTEKLVRLLSRCLHIEKSTLSLDGRRLKTATKLLIRQAGRNQKFSALINDLTNRVWSALLLTDSQLPRGFGKFGGKKSSEKQEKNEDKKSIEELLVLEDNNNLRQPPNDEKPKDVSGTSKSPGLSSSGGSSKEFKFEFKFPNKDGDGQNKFVMYAIFAVMASLTMIALSQLNYKEITWRDFVNNYLARGMVERIEIINKKYAVVVLQASNVVENNVLWFNIGSVDSLERNLENVQEELRIEPRNYVPVMYKQKIELYLDSREVSSFVEALQPAALSNEDEEDRIEPEDINIVNK